MSLSTVVCSNVDTAPAVLHTVLTAADIAVKLMTIGSEHVLEYDNVGWLSG